MIFKLAWGTGATGTPESSSLLGFGASEGFDPFLALTEPPPAPHGSPRYPGGQQHLEHDSDEEQPEFALSIRSDSKLIPSFIHKNSFKNKLIFPNWQTTK